MLERKREALPALTSLRFFAAAYVVCSHVHSWTSPSLFDPILRLGYTGVSFFFALSGFILAHTYWNEDFQRTGSRAAFFTSRFARLYPAYALACGLELCLRFILHKDVGGSSLLAVAVEFAALQSWAPGIINALINIPVWSISDEALFYYSFPKLIRRLKSVPWKLAYVYLGVWAIGIFALQILWSRYGLGASLGNEIQNQQFGTLILSRFIKFFPIFHFGEFLAGIFTYRFWKASRDRTGPNERRYLFTFSCASAIVGVCAYGYIPEMWYFMGLGCVAWCPLIIVCASMKSGILASPPLVFLGEISYGIYLFHFLIIQLLVAEAPNLLSPQTNFFFGTAIVFALTTAASAAIYLVVERPGRRRILNSFATFDRRLSLGS